MLNRIFFYTVIFIITNVLMLFCRPESLGSKEIVIIKGSDTMVNLTLSWAENLMKQDSTISIQVTGGGSGNGIAAILNGTADVANISRNLKKREILKAEKIGIDPILHPVALDGIAIVVHPTNPIDTLSIAQIKNIFSGVIKNWQFVGGNDSQIVLYGRENSSGTYEYFKSVILNSDNEKRDFATSTQVLQGTASLAEAVSLDERGIGYGGVGYFTKRKDIKIVHVKSSENKPATSPVKDDKLNYKVIWNETYPLSRYLYCLTNGKPDGAPQRYIDYITSKEGQKVVESMEYIPLPSSVELENQP